MQPQDAAKNTIEYLGLWEQLNNPDFKEHLQFVCGGLHSALTFRSAMLRQSFAPDDTRETSAKNVCSVMFRLLSTLEKQAERNLLYR